MNILFAFALFPLDSPPALYAILFVILILSGIGLPVPEEATLIAGGYLAYLEFIDFWTAIYVLSAGIIAADVGGYMLGRYAGGYVARLLNRWPPAAFIYGKAALLFSRHGDKIIIFSRPLFAVRVAVPIFAGHVKMRFWKFLLLDAVAAIPWTIFLVSASFYLGSGFDLVTEVRVIKHAFFLALGLAIILFAGVRFMKGTSQKQDMQ